MNNTQLSQIMSGIIAACNYVIAVPFPQDMGTAFHWCAGLTVAAITGWKAPSAINSGTSSLSGAINRINAEPETIKAKIADGLRRGESA